MPLETIYVVRHGFRMNFSVNPWTGAYTASVPPPTGIQTDPALTSHGEHQAVQLGAHLQGVTPPISRVYSSPYYRCLQTIRPFFTNTGKKVRCERGLGEWFGVAPFAHPFPAPIGRLQTFFSNLDQGYASIAIPSSFGESLEELHSRVAFTLHHIIATADQDPSVRGVLICTHAAVMIAIGRVLTGDMPDDSCKDDFKCFTASLSRYDRREGSTEAAMWGGVSAKSVPKQWWNAGHGVGGGWDCTLNGNCEYLDGGEERGWSFSGDEAFIDVGSGNGNGSGVEDAKAKL